MAGERRQAVVVIAGATIWYALLYGFDQFARANLEIEDCNFSRMGSCLPDSWYVFTMAGAVLAPIAVISLIFAWKKGVLTIAIGTAVAVAVLNTALFYGSGEAACPIRDPAASSAEKNLADLISGIGFLVVMFGVPLLGGWLTALKKRTPPAAIGVSLMSGAVCSFLFVLQVEHCSNSAGQVTRGLMMFLVSPIIFACTLIAALGGHLVFRGTKPLNR